MLRSAFIPLLILVSFGCFAQSNPPAVALRLPAGISPIKYQATLRVTPGQDSFSGVIRITIAFSHPTSAVTLHAKELELHQVSPAPQQIKQLPNDLVELHFARPFPAGVAELKVDYSGSVSRVLTDGAFQQEHDGDWYIFTKFEPITARRVFPCFDEPGFKVPWQLTLDVPAADKTFSNTPVETETAASDGRKVVRFRQTRPLPSYLIAFAVGPFDVVETAPVGANRVPSRIVVPKGRAAEAEYAASITPKLVEMLETYFGIPYPYEKLDQVVVPLTTAWGAMENAGMIAYGDFLLAPQSEDSESRRQRSALTMEHEISHQWFGDLVTMQWWNDLWLNEAFASWVSNKLVASWHPEWGITERLAASTSVFRADSLTTARKIRQPIETAGDIGTAFDAITYGKGQDVIGMFEHYLGEQPFARGVHSYLKAHAWKNATSDDLLASLDGVGPDTHVRQAFGTFLNQTGYPVVTVKLDCKSQPAVELTQQRLIPRGASASETALWDIPVCLSWESWRQCSLLTSPSQRFSLKSKSCPAWVFADAGSAGYYAETYNPDNSAALLSSGLAQLNRTERAAYLRNVRVLFASGAGDLEQELRSIDVFSRDPDPVLMAQAAGLLNSIADLVPKHLEPAYSARIRTLFRKEAASLGWRPKSADSAETRDLRSELLPLVATQGADKTLAAEASALAQKWLDDRSSLEAEAVPGVLFAAAWNGDKDLFDRLSQALLTSKTRRERSWIISAMAGFRDPAIAASALALIGSQGIDAREMSVLLFDANAETRETVWQYVQANFDRLNASLPSARGVPFGATLPGATSGFCDAAHAASAESFFNERLAAMPGGPRNLARSVERIHLCAAQAELATSAVASYLRP